jgi:hypothetical protein
MTFTNSHDWDNIPLTEKIDNNLRAAPNGSYIVLFDEVGEHFFLTAKSIHDLSTMLKKYEDLIQPVSTYVD